MEENCPNPSKDSSSVDDVWKRLKAATRQPAMEKLVGQVLKSANRKASQAVLPVHGLSAAFLGVDDKEETHTVISSWNSEKVPDFDSADLEQACRPYVQQLKSEAVHVRQSGMASIKKAVACPDVPSDNLVDALSSWLGKALVKSTADRSQTVRMAAISTFCDLISKHSDAVLPMLPYAIPVLEGRLHVDENGNRAEISEEIRLVLLKTVCVMVENSGGALAAYMAEVLVILRACLSDPFHEIVMPTCSCIALLAQQLRRRLQPVSKQLLADVLPLTTHRRKAVRCAAVGAIRQVMFCGAHEMILDMVAWRDPNSVAIKAFYEPDPKVNFCGKLITDSAAVVRLAFINAAGDWLLHLDERIDHQGRLLPYIMTGLTDTNREVQIRSLALLGDIGALYEQDNNKDLKDILCYLPEEAHNIGWRSLRDAWQGGSCSGIFPEIFKERPRVGARRVVASNFAGVAGGIAGELRGWHADCRCRAAALLEMYSVFVEDWMQQHVYELVPAMLQAASAAHQRMADADAVAAAGALTRCCSMMGLFVAPQCFVRMVEPVLSDTDLSAGVRAAAAVALGDFLNGAWHRGGADECAKAAIRIIQENSLSESQSSVLKQSLVSLTATVIRTASDDLVHEMQVPLISLLLRLQAWPAADAKTRQELAVTVEQEIGNLVKRLDADNSSTGVHSLLSSHREALIKMWDTNSTKLLQSVTAAAMEQLNLKGTDQTNA